MMPRRWALLSAVLAVVLMPSPLPAQSGFRYVHPTDPTCGGHSPCYTTIQAAVNATTAGEHVILQAGTYHEQVNVTGKNNTPGATENDRIVIESDPAAEVGSVVLQGSVGQCTNGHAIRLQQSKFITIRALTITGSGGQAVSLLGGNNQNQDIHLERLRIFANGSGSCDGGITIARGNPATLILNSLIYANGRNGVSTVDADGGPHYLVGNTIHGNQWSGVSVTRSHEIFLVNNAITANGTASGTTGGRFGVSRENSTTPQPSGIHLLNNLICGNRLGEISGPVLDATDAGNLTPTGTEGPGVTARAGCSVVSNLYAFVNGPDGVMNTVDDDFTPVTASPLLDAGLDPRTLGLNAAFNALLEADHLRASARPRIGTPGGAARFDIGAREPDVADQIAPLVTILAPPDNSYVRLQVPVQAQAIDQGGGVAAFTLRAGVQALITTLNPVLPPPAPAVTASATWNTTILADGIYSLTAEAEDAAGNFGSATRVLIVDNTPPETTIVDGPSGTTTMTSTSFTFAGTDNLAPANSLRFAWRLDGGEWSDSGAAHSASFSNLSQAPHTFEVKARDLAGNEDLSPSTRTFTVTTPLITITDPVAAATIAAGELIVQGSVGVQGVGIGVSVNGLPAAVRGNRFAVLIPVDATTTNVTATLTSPAGSATDTIAISVSPSDAPSPSLHAVPIQGVAPLSVAFRVTGSLHAPQFQLDVDGDGTADFNGVLDDTPFVYQQPGLYIPVATFVDQTGMLRTARGVVHVYDLATLDGALQAQWGGLKNALRQGDISLALTFIASRSRTRYAQIFSDVALDLPNVDSILTTFHLVDAWSLVAIGRMVRVDDGVAVSFEVRFLLDDDGVWRVVSF